MDVCVCVYIKYNMERKKLMIIIYADVRWRQLR